MEVIAGETEEGLLLGFGENGRIRLFVGFFNFGFDLCIHFFLLFVFGFWFL